MRRLLVAAVVLAALAGSSTKAQVCQGGTLPSVLSPAICENTPAEAAPAPTNGCRRNFTMGEFIRYGRRVMPVPTAGQSHALARMAHCMWAPRLRAVARSWQRRHQLHLTHTVYAGRVSVDNGTHVSGSLVPKCIALRRNVRNERFLLRLGSRWTVVEQCDWGPASWTGRAIDIHTPALEAMGVYYEPTDSYGTATLLR